MTINDPNNLVPEKSIAVVFNAGIDKNKAFELMAPLRGGLKREWFNPHFYYCLPLTMGNQYGFIFTAEYDFEAVWDGSSGPEGVSIQRGPGAQMQIISAHFGEGIVTIQNPWHFRTAPGINLMTITPPNMPQHGIHHMTGVIEADNLRRDFTFNIKLTEPGVKVSFKKGDPVGAFIPIQRYYVDDFKLVDAATIFTEAEISEEWAVGREFGLARQTVDTSKPHQAGRLYFKGEDSRGNKFPDHQKR
jgi:hypothetical protein